MLFRLKLPLWNDCRLVLVARAWFPPINSCLWFMCSLSLSWLFFILYKDFILGAVKVWSVKFREICPSYCGLCIFEFVLQASELFKFAFTTQLLHRNSFCIKCDLLVVDLWVIRYSCSLLNIPSCFIIHPALLTVNSFTTDVLIFNLRSSPFELLERARSLHRRKF